jgi:8-oxo-dGTP diphosphatase
MSPIAIEDVEAAMQTLLPAEAASAVQLRSGLVRKMRAWLRGEA